jgi:NADP-dependent 3-hydroxy acid dehydrogenase YdfG
MTQDADAPVLWVTGAGSGIGRAVAVQAAARGSRVVLSGRRGDALAGTSSVITDAGGRSLVVPLDATDPPAVQAAHETITATWGPVTELVLAAGLNTPDRYWRDQSIERFERIVATNLVAVARVVDAVLPDMREAGHGHVVVVSSYSAWRFSPHAGVAYSASKSALAALCQTLNEQEAAHGIRSCHLCPGDVDTEFLAFRPNVPDEAARKVMLSPDDVAAAVRYVLDAPAHVRIDELVISPMSQT